jgi:hypothetical protein
MPDQTSDSSNASNAAAERAKAAQYEAERQRLLAEQAAISTDPYPPMLKDPVFGSSAAEPVTAATKLRDFEHEVFGRDAPRINGDLERGVGSPWANMTPYQKAHHASLEALVKAEKAVADASADLETARLKHDAAVKVSEAAEKAIADADAAAAEQAAQNPPPKAA